jgi:hypothetical protein
MSTGWEIKGEAGRALDATVRSLVSINARNASLTLASLAPDTFDYTLALADAAATGAIVPDHGQLIEIFHNGTRRFRGHVTVPRMRNGYLHVRAEGPWWWWQRIPLTSSQTDSASVTKERPVYVFLTQSLKTSLETLIDRAIANGVPIIRGTVATMYDFPRITLAEKSCGQALADLMSAVPDAVAYYDYTGASGTFPTLHIARRGSMATETITIGTDTVEDVDIYPRLDLEVASIKVGAATRNATTGALEYTEQTSGIPTAGKNQVIVVSGPEIGDFLPEDKDNTVQIQTFTMPTGGVALGTLSPSSSHSSTSVTGMARTFALRDPQIATLIREFGSGFSNNLYLSNGGKYNVSLFTSGSLSGSSYILMDRPNLISAAPTAGMYVIASEDVPPDWLAAENGYTLTDAVFTAYVRYTAWPVTSDPAFWVEAVRYAEQAFVGYLANVSGQTAGNYEYSAFFPVRIPCKLISTSFSSLTTIYRAWAYDYIQPPAGLAPALLAAQNYPPYEGHIRTVIDAVNGAQALDKKYRLANSLAAHATMDALPRAVKYEIQRGRREIQLGAPARIDFGSLAARFRRHPKDNIVYL